MGLTMSRLHEINTEMTLDLLAFREIKMGEVTDDHSHLLFELLLSFNAMCEMTKADRYLAKHHMSLIKRSKLPEPFPNISKAIDVWIGGDPYEARKRLSEHLTKDPEDVVVIYMLHMLDFLYGNKLGFLEVSSIKESSENVYLRGYVHGIKAFCNCESGDLNNGYGYASEALKTNPTDIYAMHAMVHYHHYRNDNEGVINYLSKDKNIWEANQGMNMHMLWHMAIAQLSLGRQDDAMHCFSQFDSFKKSPMELKDLDGVNFMFRLYMTSGRPAIRYQKAISNLVDNWSSTIKDSLSYFNLLHAGMIFVCGNRTDLLEELVNLDNIDSLDEKTNKVGKGILNALLNYNTENFRPCTETLKATQNYWHLIGGSRAQREVLNLLLEDSEWR